MVLARARSTLPLQVTRTAKAFSRKSRKPTLTPSTAAWAVRVCVCVCVRMCAYVYACTCVRLVHCNLTRPTTNCSESTDMVALPGRAETSTYMFPPTPEMAAASRVRCVIARHVNVEFMETYARIFLVVCVFRLFVLHLAVLSTTKLSASLSNTTSRPSRAKIIYYYLSSKLYCILLSCSLKCMIFFFFQKNNIFFAPQIWQHQRYIVAFAVWFAREPGARAAAAVARGLALRYVNSWLRSRFFVCLL